MLSPPRSPMIVTATVPPQLPPSSKGQKKQQQQLAGEEKKRSRQRPGTACLECRNRKLKCDGTQPRCEKCVSSGGECTPTTRMPRGPKKGHLRILQNRIEMLEQRLVESQNQYIPEVEPTTFCPEEPFSNSAEPLFDMNDMFLPPDLFPLATAMPLGSVSTISGPITPTVASNTGSSSPMLGVRLSDTLDPQMDFILSDDFLRTDLNQLYFERVQQSVPILHRASYFAWARSPNKTEAQVCLQYAMWTMAASLASQFQEVRETLYQFTQLSLEVLESRDETLSSIEHAQARLLLCLYELMRKNPQRAWISAGRCFRLLQLMRLHDIDGPDGGSADLRRNSAQSQATTASSSCASSISSGSDADDWIRQEQRRRTFWVAYALDMFISVRGSWHPTLHEHTINTHLPMPEEEFQNGSYVEMPALTDPAQVLESTQRSALTEFVTLASLFRHLAVHRQLSAGEQQQQPVVEPGAAAAPAFWTRHNRLEEAVKARAGVLMHHFPSAACQFDPVLLFTSMMLHAAVLCLCETMELAVADEPAALDAARRRSLQLARSILGLSRSLPQLSYLKVHPLTPLPLCICVEFLDSHRYLDECTTSHIQEIYASLREMSNVNNLAHDYLLEQNLQPV